MTHFVRAMITVLIACSGLATSVLAEEAFVLTSPALTEGGDLPADLRCTRDGGDGVTPPLDWSFVPDGTESLALIMHHYPRGKVEGVDAPSQYWLVWNIPADTSGIPRGNPASIGDEGAAKDGTGSGYTAPCSPPGSRHEYTITIYALHASPASLPSSDSINVDWAAMMDAIEDNIIASSSISFWN